MSDSTSTERAASADAALSAYMSRTRCDCDDCLADLLRDLMHWADKTRFNFADEFRRAYFHYRIEVADEKAAKLLPRH